MARAKAAPSEADPFADFEPIDTPMPYDEPPEMALIVEPTPQAHLIVGAGALAALSPEEFQRNLDMTLRAQERMETIQSSIMQKGTDYGTVPGIPRPFLQKPGAEKLANFYGLAVRFEADRITRKPTEGPDVPPLAYHVRAYAHLGNFDGPVVGQGFGESNVYEERYRWRQAKAVCPKCGREGLIRGKPDGKLKGKWWCPGREGGCNSTFEAADPAVMPPGKIENTDPWSLANTLIKMAEKRAHVDVVLRATGASGRFSQDEDSPAVRQQSEERGGGEAAETEPITVAAGPVIEVAAGAKIVPPTQIQLAELTRVTQEKDIDAEALAALIERLFNFRVDPTNAAIIKAVKGMTGMQVGTLIMSATTGEVPEEAAAAIRAAHREADAASYSDDIGAK